MTDAAPKARPVWLPATLRLLILTAAALLGLGLVAPAMTITTSFGRYDGWVRLVASDLLQDQPATYSLLGGILTLVRGDDFWIGLLLLAFSVCFPTLKLATMAGATETLARGGRGGPLLWLAHHSGKFSMLDVLVLAMLVLAIKGLPGSSTLTLGWGVWTFGASVLLSLLASLLLHRLERLPRDREVVRPAGEPASAGGSVADPEPAR